MRYSTELLLRVGLIRIMSIHDPGPPHFYISVTHRLCKDVYQAGCIPQLCQLVSKSPTLHSSCLRILVAMVTKTEGVTEVRKHLPIDSLCKLLNSEPEVQVCVSVFCPQPAGYLL